MGNKVMPKDMAFDTAQDVYGRLATIEQELSKAMELPMTKKLWQELRIIRNTMQSIENQVYMSSHEGGH